MDFNYPRRFTVALALVIALAVVSDTYFVIAHRIFTATGPSYEEAALYEKKFAELRPLLPPRGPVGYLGDSKNDLSDPKARRRYYLTQYTLAPVIVANTISLRVVIGNFHEDSGVLDYEGLTLARDFGNGARLFRNDSAQSETSD